MSTWVHCLWRPGEGIHPPRIEITSGCEVLHVGAGDQTEGHDENTVPSRQTLSHLSSPTL